MKLAIFEQRSKTFADRYPGILAWKTQINCDGDELTSLDGCPAIVDGDFNCSENFLKNLAGGPSIINGSYYCDDNEITSLEGTPNVVKGSFHCTGNKLPSLKNVHKHLQMIQENAYFNNNPIESHVLGLMKIEGLKKVELDNSVLQKIINRHLAGDRNILACQEELIDAGFEKYAQL